MHEKKEALIQVTQERDSLKKELNTLTETSKSLTSEIDTQKKKFSSLYLKWESSKAELSALKEKVELVPQLNREEGHSNEELHSGDMPADDVDQAPPPGPSVHVSHDVGGICFTEFLGKCPRSSEACKFSHDITPEMKNDVDLITRITNAKEEKAAKCVNEFMRKGSCRKKKLCRFSHNITDDHRCDPSLRATMTARYQQLTGSSANISLDSYQRNSPSGNLQEEGHDQNGSSQIHESWHTQFTGGNNTIFDLNGYQQQEQQTFRREPQPLMSIQTRPPRNPPTPPLAPQALPSINAETANLLHSLLSQLLVKQTNDQYAPQIRCF